MGAMDDLLAEYEEKEPEASAKADGASKYPTVEELFGKGSDTPAVDQKAEAAKAQQARDAAARQPAKMPANARPGDSGLLPEPEPFSWGGAAKAVGKQFIEEAKAIPAGFNDAFSMGAIPAIQESGSLPPGTYQRTMEAGPVGAAIGQAAGLVASGGAGLGKPLAEGGQLIASGLRRSGAFASPTVERAVASGVGSGLYGASDAAMRGGTPEQVFDAGMTGGAVGAAIPIAAKGVGVAKNAANRIADKSIAAAEERGMEGLIDKATWGKSDKAATQLTKKFDPDASIDAETAGREAILKTARKHDLGKDMLSQSTSRIANAVDVKREAAGAKVGKYIDDASQFTPGVRLDGMVKSLEDIRSGHAADSDQFKAITQKIESLMSTYGETNVVSGVPRVPLWEVRDMATKYADMGYAGQGAAFSNPTAARKLGREMAFALRRPLYDEVNRVALRNPSSVGTPEGFAKARADYADLSALQEITEAARAKTTTGKKGLFGRMDAWDQVKRAVAGSTAAVASSQIGMPHEVTALLAATPYIRPVASAGNAELSKLISAARSGLPASAYNAAAESLSVSPEIAARVWQQFAPAAAGSASSQEVLSQPGQVPAP